MHTEPSPLHPPDTRLAPHGVALSASRDYATSLSCDHAIGRRSRRRSQPRRAACSRFPILPKIEFGSTKRHPARLGAGPALPPGSPPRRPRRTCLSPTPARPACRPPPPGLPVARPRPTRTGRADSPSRLTTRPAPPDSPARLARRADPPGLHARHARSPTPADLLALANPLAPRPAKGLPCQLARGAGPPELPARRARSPRRPTRSPLPAKGLRGRLARPARPARPACPGGAVPDSGRLARPTRPGPARPAPPRTAPHRTAPHRQVSARPPGARPAARCQTGCQVSGRLPGGLFG